MTDDTNAPDYTVASYEGVAYPKEGHSHLKACSRKRFLLHPIPPFKISNLFRFIPKGQGYLTKTEKRKTRGGSSTKKE